MINEDFLVAGKIDTSTLTQSVIPPTTLHAKRQESAKCPVCRVKYQAGNHRRKCQQEHRIKWFIYGIFHRAP